MRLIDADKLRSDIIKNISFLKSAEENLEIMGGCIDDAPTVDAVEVVRCKDCKFNLANIEDIQDGININENWNACYLTELYDSVEPTGFCSRGERKENETN